MSKKFKEGLRTISHQIENINKDTEIINGDKLKFWSWQVQLKLKKKKVGEFSSSFEQKKSATEIWDYPVLEKWTVPETFETLWSISTYA